MGQLEGQVKEKGHIKYKPLDVEKQGTMPLCQPDGRYVLTTRREPRPHVCLRWAPVMVVVLGLTICGIFYHMHMCRPAPVTMETTLIISEDILVVHRKTKVIEWSISSSEDAGIKSEVKDTDDSAGYCDVKAEDDRFDCFPDGSASQQACEARGCCWKSAGTGQDKPPQSIELPSANGSTSHIIKKTIGTPWCYFPSNYPSYVIKDKPKQTTFGLTATLIRTKKSPWPNDINELQFDGYMETSSRFHFKIYDPNHKRYEVPVDTPKVSKAADNLDYSVKLSTNPFSIQVSRKSNQNILFDTSVAPVIFADQFLQISSQLPSKYIYGLGEHRGPFLQDLNWKQLNFWARDQPPVSVSGVNLYGDHPFYLSVEEDGTAHGVFLLNSNAMDVDLQPKPAITYRTIGGIFDFYLFIGKNPDDVIRQYVQLIGLPFLPPYWSLGFHLCRWGYNSKTELTKVISRMREAKFPYDAQWSDIDYMDHHKDWTYDSVKYNGLPEVVKDLHDHGQKYVIIVDPGISSTQQSGTYPPYDLGLKLNIFIKNATGGILIGAVWPGKTAFPDFTHPQAPDYWYQSALSYHNQVPFDGLWTDMNEPSNFISGSTQGCPKDKWNNPPYTPGILDGDLKASTVCPSAEQYLGQHYNLHSLYGHFETISSHRALGMILKKRSIVISRSSFPSTGRYAGHWLGDNSATWDDLYYSLPGVLNFQMFGIPLVGADICGFGGETTEELCTRWMQAGAFYPFMRNHNTVGAKDQDPAVFSPSAQDMMRQALELRYSLLPYLYTLFAENHLNGTAVARPLFFQYPLDPQTYAIDKQFMWGSGLLISPVVSKGATTVSAYMPKDYWYSLNGSVIQSKGQTVTLDAPINVINVHVRGGSIIPMQDPAVTTTLARKNPFRIMAGLSPEGTASGQLFWDDGESLNTLDDGKYNLISFTISQNQFESEPQHTGYSLPRMPLEELHIMGITKPVTMVTSSGASVPFSYDASTQSLYVQLKEDLMKAVAVLWK